MSTSKTSLTSFERKASILAEFSVKYKNDDRFAKLFRDNDLGFPYAFGVHFGHIETSDIVKLYIEDTWTMLLLQLLPEPEFDDLLDTGFETLDQLVQAASLD
jgi:hypothetical protein